MHTPPNNERLYFLDWVRVIAFFLLILYHVGMYYVSWDWHVKSPHASSAIEPLMMLSSPWRLGLLFMISGVASAFLLQKLGAGRLARQRSSRLLLPLLFGMLVIVPPQPYFEVIEKVGYAGSYADFMRLYLSAYHGFCKDNACLDLPTWNHLWFVAYLWVYTLLLAALAALFGQRLDVLGARLAQLLTGWKAIVLPLAVLAAVRLALVGRYPSTHALVGDWFNHANYLALFLLGALLARQRRFWDGLADVRWPALAIALSCWALVVVYFALPDSAVTPAQVAVLRPLQRIAFAACEWCAIVAACGFARVHLQADSRALRYLTPAVFTVYILHQTLIVSIAHGLKPAQLSAPVEALVLVVLTATLSFGTYELVRRVPLLRPLFGIGGTAPTRMPMAQARSA